MFRKPREDASSSVKVPLTPSTGRPPTPPNSKAPSLHPTMSSHSSKPLTPRTNSKSNAPPNRSNLSAKRAGFGSAKTPGKPKPNTSILNFFKKVDGPLKEDSIFLSQGAREGPILPSPGAVDEEIGDLYDDERFNEAGGSVKKRKTSREPSVDGDEPTTAAPDVPPKAKTKQGKRRRGPFLSDSDTEDEEPAVIQKFAVRGGELKNGKEENEVETDSEAPEDIEPAERLSGPKEGRRRKTQHQAKGKSGLQLEDKATWDTPIPPLPKEDTSMDQWGEFDDAELDEYADGEEFTERRWMEEQDQLEGDEEEEFNGFPPDKEEMTASCPICDTNLDGLGPDEATKHVNGCLDAPLESKPEPPKLMHPDARERFARKAAPKPLPTGSAQPSAFAALMSGNAEDAAWASAAASEQSSRGKPAYRRTCPFYKIMPGFFICVDAFRYGAVPGCNAYFLSHFHSDHYVGLTSTWSHGPIYCSTVTASLVEMQLRVDPKWLVPLDFDERFEVPETQGATVTMIPANHCPGSSMFLFEKAMEKGRVQRVLHCGDFRACPAHLAHPLLVPDIVDSITGRTRQQKIDVCYLDTTYLNPRYAFPPQEEVIQACTAKCLQLTGTGPTDAGSMAGFVSGAGRGRGRLLVVCGTYSIGKERLCVGIARALDCKIWAPAAKRRMCGVLEDAELASRMTDDPREAQVHMQMLMEIRPETLLEYLEGYGGHFGRVVGFRPSGWNYRPKIPPGMPTIPDILHSPRWRATFTLSDLVPQRGSGPRATCFGVPYSEHSSFRELAVFACGLRIARVVPTVNVGSAASRAQMRGWIEKWAAERRRAGGVVSELSF